MLILFDVDGVLVHSRAYHRGLQQTVAYFSRRMGVGEHYPTQEEIDLFEAHSITVEWESAAISTAALLLERLRRAPLDLPVDFWAALDILGAQPLAVPRPDFGALARRIGAGTPPGTQASRTALRLFGEDLNGGPLTARVQPVLEQLLGHCFDVDRAPALQVVQNFAVGHALYADAYGLPPHFECAALLATEDRPLLQPALRDRLLAERAAGRLRCGLYTARPSLPPVEVAERLRGYTPEAELALDLVGLPASGPERLPVIAFGKLAWAAQRHGAEAMDLVKPSPVQPLAAMAAARTGAEAAALDAAVALVRAGELQPALAACAGETIHVFEDSPGSLRAATQAAALLAAQGVPVTLVRHGVAAPGSPKHTALSQIADRLHADINAGLAQIL